ncbi:MAG TPA: HisA/HisF-related TIM barrel protein [Acidimicrobiales bacterium]|jgi:phosphoribosylformimino-5-aminoimidazole carboxamide ribotide isomerase
MDLFPAIDLREGKAVRLTQGDFARQQAYGDPLDLARSYLAGGARWIHVVDLDAARTGVPHQREVVAAIAALAAEVGVPVQSGGGVRTPADVAALLEAGVNRVVMGTAAIETPALAGECARAFPGQVVVGLDYVMDAEGKAQALAHGWKEGTGVAVRSLLAAWVDEPIAAVVATCIARDGMLRGPDLIGMRTLLGLTSFPVVASGGVAELEDLRALSRLANGGQRLAGVIVGKAIVEGRFSVKEGVAACAASV